MPVDPASLDFEQVVSRVVRSVALADRAFQGQQLLYLAGEVARWPRFWVPSRIEAVIAFSREAGGAWRLLVFRMGEWERSVVQIHLKAGLVPGEPPSADDLEDHVRVATPSILTGTGDAERVTMKLAGNRGLRFEFFSPGGPGRGKVRKVIRIDANGTEKEEYSVRANKEGQRRLEGLATHSLLPEIIRAVGEWRRRPSVERTDPLRPRQEMPRHRETLGHLAWDVVDGFKQVKQKLFSVWAEGEEESDRLRAFDESLGGPLRAAELTASARAVLAEHGGLATDGANSASHRIELRARHTAGPDGGGVCFDFVKPDVLVEGQLHRDFLRALQGERAAVVERIAKAMDQRDAQTRQELDHFIREAGGATRVLFARIRKGVQAEENGSDQDLVLLERPAEAAPPDREKLRAAFWVVMTMEFEVTAKPQPVVRAARTPIVLRLNGLPWQRSHNAYTVVAHVRDWVMAIFWMLRDVQQLAEREPGA